MLGQMREKPGGSFTKHFSGADPQALRLLRRMLAFDAQQRPSAAEALRDPYFAGFVDEARELSGTPLSALDLQFESQRLDIDDVRGLIYDEIVNHFFTPKKAQVRLPALCAVLLPPHTRQNTGTFEASSWLHLLDHMLQRMRRAAPGSTMPR
jgi:serine/threonine protein kinase